MVVGVAKKLDHHELILPPGFRFHPTDEELIVYYLKNQATSRPCPVSNIIPELELYKFDPWDLPDQAEFGEKEWYFFTPRDRKYPNGVRPNRAAVSGYWKATGTDKPIYSCSKYVGVKKALVFYTGRPPKGLKTDWIMHEYRLTDHHHHHHPLPNPNTKQTKLSMRLDDWVLCRIYKKKKSCITKAIEAGGDQDNSSILAGELKQTPANMNEDPPLLDLKHLPRVCSISHLWDFDSFGSSTLFNETATFDYLNGGTMGVESSYTSLSPTGSGSSHRSTVDPVFGFHY